MLDYYKYNGEINVVPAWDVRKRDHGIDFVNKKIRELKGRFNVRKDVPVGGVIIDALLGYKLKSEHSDEYSCLIDEANGLNHLFYLLMCQYD